MLRPIHVGLLAVLMVSPSVAPAQAPPVEISVVRSNMLQTREALTTVVLEASQTMSATRDGVPMGQPMESDFRLVFGDDRLRMEANSRMGNSTTVYNGMTTWLYVEQLQQYTEVVGAPNFGGPGGAGPAQPQSLRDAVLDRVVPLVPDTAEVTGTEVLQTEVGPVECIVVQHGLDAAAGPEAEGTITLWIDPQLWAVRRGEVAAPRELAPGMRAETHSLFLVTSLQVDVPLRDEEFAFVAPEGAEKVDQFTAPGMASANWAGKEAPDFTLSDLNGTRYQLSELRGKVVLLDFWATWCGPCKIELPHVEKLRREFAEDGLVVLAISHEPASKVRSYLARTDYGFPSLVDEGASVTRAYQVSSIPVVLIVDREGKVAKHYVGAQTEQTLRAGLAAAGLE